MCTSAQQHCMFHVYAPENHQRLTPAALLFDRCLQISMSVAILFPLYSIASYARFV